MFEAKQFTRNVGIRQRSLRKHCRFGRATELVYVLATGVALTIAGSADAQDTQTFTGNTDQNWNTVVGSDNWTGAGGNDFAAGDNAVLADTDLVITVNEGSPISVGDLTVTDGDATPGGLVVVDGAAPNALDISGTIDVQADASAAIQVDIVNNADAVGAGGLSVGNVGGNVSNTGSGFVTVAGAVTGNLDNQSGTTNVNSGGSIGGTANISGGTSTVAGTITGTTTVTDGVLALSNGDLGDLVVSEATADGANDATLSSGTVATLTNTAGTTLVSGATVQGATTVTGGTVQVTSGTLTGASSVSGGVLDVDGGDIGTVDTSLSGVADISGGTVASLDQGSTGTSSLTGGTITGDVTVSAGTLNVAGGTISGTSDVSGGTLDVDSGTVAGVDVSSS
ncbi:MAG: hypothetical protein AAF601_05505, partial [Pseudomonadota bacterium]